MYGDGEREGVKVKFNRSNTIIMNFLSITQRCISKSEGNLLLRVRAREGGREVEGKGNGKNCIYLFFVNSFFLLTYSLMFLLCKILALDE